MDINAWVDLLLFLTGCLAVFLLKNKGKNTDNRVMYLMFLSAMSVFCLSTLITFFNFTMQFNVRHFLQIMAISFAVSGIFILIRHSKPVFARFPQQFVYLPFLIVIFYPIVDQTIVIKNLVRMIYQGGALFVAALLIPTSKITKHQKWLILGGISIFAISFLFKWIFIVDESQAWLWGIILLPAILLTAYGFYKLPEINLKG